MRRLGLMLLALSGTAQATLQLDSSVSLRTGWWSGDRALTDETDVKVASLWVRERLSSRDQGELVFDGWAQQRNIGGQRHGRVREAYWHHEFDDYDLRIGRQIVVWGRADGINPTDNLAPRDFTLLTPEDGDQRYGADMLNLTRYVGDGSVALMWFPEAPSHTIPLVPLANVDYDIRQSGRSQWAAKWEWSAPNMDGSLSYLDGVYPLPVLTPGLLTSQGATVQVQAQRSRILGMDFSMTQGAMVWRAEAAYSRPDSNGQEDFLHKKPQLFMVMGGEWTFRNNATLGLQATYTHVYDFSQPQRLEWFAREVALRQMTTSGQTASDQYGFTWRVAKRWLNDNLSLEASGVANVQNDSGIARLKASYMLSDHVRLLGGIEGYYGREDTFFGQLHDNHTVYVQAEYGF